MVEAHAAPGSQKSWNHSGSLGHINWLNGTNGEIQRTLAYLQQMVKFFSSSDYVHVNPIMDVLEDLWATIHDGFLSLSADCLMLGKIRVLNYAPISHPLTIAKRRPSIHHI